MRIFMLAQPPEAAGPTPGIAALLAEELTQLGCTVATHPWGGSRSKGARAQLLGTLRNVRAVRNMTRRRTFDLALVHTAHDWNTLARDIPLALALRRRGPAVVLHLHGSHPERLALGHAFRAATSLLLRLVDGVLVLSREEQERWAHFTSRVPVFVIRNPYATSRNSPSAGKLTPNDPPVVLFVGRLLREKGVFDLVDAMPLVAKRTRCRLVLVGDGPCAAELRSLTRTLGLDDDVTFAGFLTGDQLRRAYAEADVFALPTYWPEGFPTVLTEAMEAGLPIVTTRTRGAADHLAAGEHALFVEPANVGDLAANLAELLDDRELRQRMGEANRRRLSEFEPSVVATEYLNTLERITALRKEDARS
jgi:glycosyltransferase involved in cell wall biosynthesis